MASSPLCGLPNGIMVAHGGASSGILPAVMSRVFGRSSQGFFVMHQRGHNCRIYRLWDVTVLRLLNSKKLYLRGVVDNFSRRLLAWCLLRFLSNSRVVG